MLARGLVPLDPVQESSSFDVHQEATQSHFKHSSRKPRLLQSRAAPATHVPAPPHEGSPRDQAMASALFTADSQAMVKIEDMAVSLILEEWGCQNLARRNPSRDNRQENYGNMFSQANVFAAFQHAIHVDSFQEEKGSVELLTAHPCSKGNQGLITLYWPSMLMAANISDGESEQGGSRKPPF
uniref:Zinc finger with KRAB and SCAN domains 1 n=1 Tax=Prolemur simus TaxID=1328070 RepID=A0A8C8YIC1_PROSS